MMREAAHEQDQRHREAANTAHPPPAGARRTIPSAPVAPAPFRPGGLADRAAEIIEQSTGIKPKLFITGATPGMITGTMRSAADRAGSGAAGVGRDRVAIRRGGLSEGAGHVSARPEESHHGRAGFAVGHATDERVQSVGPYCVREDGRRGSTSAAAARHSRDGKLSRRKSRPGRAHAVVLAGGSVFGLAAADGVTTALSRKGTD